MKCFDSYLVEADDIDATAQTDVLRAHAKNVSSFQTSLGKRCCGCQGSWKHWRHHERHNVQ